MNAPVRLQALADDLAEVQAVAQQLQQVLDRVPGDLRTRLCQHITRGLVRVQQRLCALTALAAPDHYGW